MPARRDARAALPVAGARIAMISVHTSPVAQPGGYAAGGMNVYIRETALRLGRLGYAVDIFTRDNGTLAPVLPLGAGVRLISLPAGPAQPLPKEQTAAFLPEFLHALRRFGREHNLRYDLIHSHYWHGGWVAGALAARWRVPHVAMFHTLGEVKNRAHLREHEGLERIVCERAIAASADRLICAGEHERQTLLRFYGAPPERTVVIPCGVDLCRFRPLGRDASRAGLGLDDRPLVLYVGRIEPLKGLDVLIEAMGQLESRDARLLVVGGDAEALPEIERLKARAAALGLGDRVRFVGAVDQAALPRYYNAADVCVVPSYYESFGLVAVEAMACGTPVVASRVGGLATTVSDGETGYLIPWQCPEPFAERIDLILQNKDLRANLSRTARRSVRRFSWDRITAALAAEYSSLRREPAVDAPRHPAPSALPAS